MDAAQLATITDVETLRGIVAEQLVVIAARDAKIAVHDRLIHYKDTRIAALTTEIARLRRVQFAARSEKMDPEQRALFEESIAADIEAVETQLDALRSPAAASPSRNVPQRRPLPPELPRIETRHEPASCDCAQCGAALVHIGDHVSGPLLRILRSQHLHIHVQRSSIASRWSSSCGGRYIRNTPAVAA